MHTCERIIVYGLGFGWPQTGVRFVYVRVRGQSHGRRHNVRAYLCHVSRMLMLMMRWLLSCVCVLVGWIVVVR